MVLISPEVKESSCNAETLVQPLGQEDSLEKEMATHSPVFLPGESHGHRSLAGYSPRGCRVRHN